MNFGIIPENFRERLALWLGLIPIPIVDLVFGSLKVRAIMAGVSLGVFEALRDGPRTSADLAKTLGLDHAALESLLRALAHVKYLKSRKDRYRLSSLARQTMVVGAPMELTSYVRWHETQWQFLDHLESLVQTGRGVDFHRQLENNQTWAHYQRGMFEASRCDAPALARLVPIPAGATRLIDVGGGHGFLGAEICRKHPPMRSTVIDLPQAVEHGPKLAREFGYSELVDFRAGDILSGPLREANAALLANILHHLSPVQVQSLFQRIRSALRPGGTMAIWQLEAPRRDRRSDHGDVAALFFRLTSTSELFHGTHYASWLTAAGYSAVRIVRPRLLPGRILVLAEA